MEIVGTWLSENWFDALTVLTGLSGLWFAGFAIHRDAQARGEEAKARKFSNQIAVTSSHREVWKEFFHSPELKRVIESAADVSRQPVTPEEEFFVQLVISNTGLMYEALKGELVTEQEGFRRDIQSFFSLPVPRAVWSATKRLQNQDFAAYIDASLKND